MENIFSKEITASELEKITGGIANLLLKNYRASGISSAYEAYRFSPSYKQPSIAKGTTTWSR